MQSLESSDIKGVVLTVDDALYVRAAVKKALEPRGFTVLQASDGHHARSLLESYHGELSLIFLDIVMPRMNGLEFLRSIREEGLNVPVVMLSAASSKKMLIECADLGISGFLAKPLVMDQIFSKVEEVLGIPMEADKKKVKRLLTIDMHDRSRSHVQDIMEDGDILCQFPDTADSFLECLEDLQYNAVMINVACFEPGSLQNLHDRLERADGSCRFLLYSSETSRLLTGGERRMADTCLTYPLSLEKIVEALT